MKYSFLSFFLPFTKYPYVGRATDCPGCGGQGSLKVSSLDRRFKLLPTVSCNHCGLLYISPMPTDAELGVYYSKYYRFDYQAATTKPKERHLRKRKREAAARAAVVAGMMPQNGRSLDFGCGSGEFVSAMLAEGHDALGFEPGETYGNYAKSRLGDRIEVKGWQDVAHDEPFDLVTCFHVLEHLNAPVPALKQMAEWVRPGGHVYVEVPNMGMTAGNKGFGGFHFGHLTGFNHHNLIVAAAQAGLSPVKTVYATGIVFRREGGVDVEAEAANGLKLARQLYGNGQATSQYWRYQLSKLIGANRN